MSITRAKRISLAFSAFGLALAFGFQNCSKVDFSVDKVSTEQFMSTAALKINNGAPFTRDQIVSVQISAQNAAEMYITNDSTCQAGGSWEKFQPERKWSLGQLNTRATVYARFKSQYGSLLPCIEASIVHDDTDPTVTIVDRPKEFAAGNEATTTFRGEDTGSGVDHYECRSNSEIWARCETPWTITDLVDGNINNDVRVVDRAGNISAPDNDSFVVDRIRPTVRFTETPPAISNGSTAIFRFEANDAASGIDTIFCQLDSMNATGQPVEGCTSPSVLTNLGSMAMDVRYRYIVWAFDGAGNRSDNIYYDFIVDRAPSGAFEIIGITGGTDNGIDNLLGSVPNPTVHWTPSAGAATYAVSVLDYPGAAEACRPVTVSATQTTYNFSPNACSLEDGKQYRARVVATDGVGNTRPANDYVFRVDVSGPKITISGPELSNETKEAKFDFTITDPSGVDSAFCYKGTIGQAAEAMTACKSLTTVTYTNLNPGDHTFRIVATDGAGNTSTSDTIPWKALQIVCDPFGGSKEVLCKKGLKANLYYLSSEQLKRPFKDVSRYINEGVKANALIYMAKLFVPTKPWTTGFMGTDGTVVKDNDGNKLFEYFALDFETVIKLDPTKNEPGLYQFAVLSDDGTIIEVKSSPAATSPAVLINNDGYTPSRLGCDMKGIQMNAESRIPMRIKYFQGPRAHIAITLLWRKISPGQSLAEAQCGHSGNHHWFGDIDKNPPNYTDFAWGSLVKKGWKPLDESNFILDENTK